MSVILSGWSHAAGFHPSAAPRARSNRARHLLREMLKAGLFMGLMMLVLAGLTLLRFWHFGGTELVSALTHALANTLDWSRS